MSTKKRISPESIVREIKRRTGRKFTAEEKIRIVLEGLRGEESITDLCRCFQRLGRFVMQNLSERKLSILFSLLRYFNT